MYIPSHIDFNSDALFNIPVDDFDLIYSEILTADGESFSNKCGNQILGQYGL